MKKLRQNYPTSAANFVSIRKRLFWISFFSILFTFLSLAIVGLKVFYPFHVFIGVSLYLLSFIPIIRRIYLSRKVWKKYKAFEFSEKFFRKEKRRIVATVVFLIFATLFLWLRPIDESPFSKYTDAEIHRIVQDDLYKSVTAMDYLETTGNDLLTKLESEEENSNFTKELNTLFNEFLKAVTFSEYITDKHRYFSSVPSSQKKTFNIISYFI